MSLAELTDPAAVRQAIGEFNALGRTAFLARYGFGRAREYMLRLPSGELYDSKAIAGAAFGYQFPERGPMRSEDFSGGENTVQQKLDSLGFDVVRIGDVWSREEVELAVADYLAMLDQEARGSPYNKAEHNAQLRAKLRTRSKGSVELKHQNISAVLDELELPYIRGYKPRSNVQDLLREVVREIIDKQRPMLNRVVDEFEAVRQPSDLNYRAAVVDPPTVESKPEAGLRRPRVPRKLDYAARDECNRNLGRAGEGWTIGFEEERLTGLNRVDLVQQIDWVADRLGDGAGYDIKSFERDASNRYIEVKTTNGGVLTPFVISANELEFSKEAGGAFFLYRLFEYRELPRLFILQGDLSVRLSLTPLDYRARLRAL
jgi:Domain of unknown function (DUF3883)